MATVSPLDSPVPPCWNYVLRLPRDPRAARVARLTVRAALTTHGMGQLLDVTELLTSELVTNAYRHTHGPASLRLVALGADWLRVFVWDASPHIPPPFDQPDLARTPPPLSSPTDAENGRGLILVHSAPTDGGAGRWRAGASGGVGGS